MIEYKKINKQLRYARAFIKINLRYRNDYLFQRIPFESSEI